MDSQTNKTYNEELPALGTESQGSQGQARRWPPLKKHLTQKRFKDMAREGRADPNNLPCGSGLDLVPRRILPSPCCEDVGF